MQRKAFAPRVTRGNPLARMAIGAAIGLAAFALFSNAKDMQKYVKLLSMSAKRPSGHP